MTPRVYEPGRANLPRLRPQTGRPTSRINLPSATGAEAMGESRAPSLPPPVPADP
jgi:hypothetical protein